MVSDDYEQREHWPGRWHESQISVDRLEEFTRLLPVDWPQDVPLVRVTTCGCAPLRIEVLTGFENPESYEGPPFLLQDERESSHHAVTQETLALYEHVLVLSWEQYYTSGTRYIAQHIPGWIQSLLELLPFTLAERQTHLLSLLCRLYQLSGVVARDRTDFAQAHNDGKTALGLAFQLEQAELIASSLFRYAKTLLKQQHLHKGLEHLEAACVYAKQVQSPLKGYIFQATAEASALLGASMGGSFQHRALVLLDQAEQVLATASGEDDGSFVKLNQVGLALDRAGALIQFRRFHEARSALTLAHTPLGTTLPRWQTRFLLADAHLSFAENDLEGVVKSSWMSLLFCKQPIPKVAWHV